MWIDTHCHLDAAEFAADRDAVAAAAQAAGVATIVVPAVAVANFAAVRDCCRRYPGCVPAYGIHPMYTPQARDEDLPVLRGWLERERPVAVGEIGLDFFVPGLDPQRQLHFFVEQLKLARDFDLPVLLHVRRAVDPILRELRRYRLRGGIAHAFNGSRQQAEVFIDLGFKLGFGGAMTWSRATRLRALAAELPREAIVLETDAPDIPPQFAVPDPASGRARNEPALLPRIAETLAAAWSLPLPEVAGITSRNAISILSNITE
ncbi:TatD family hydrolase [Azospira restricta]|uniref:TatD family hydrolase n=1 Tax=Azospira restricta TaxID=404405 RepID=A0A974Y4N8_9RHOO|nr:TatD family hydrolase [Azospira restricta]QRJ64695.1 TatD family hydrolase [Azospira restricta]